jgi:hypothetical protein
VKIDREKARVNGKHPLLVLHEVGTEWFNVFSEKWDAIGGASPHPGMGENQNPLCFGSDKTNGECLVLTASQGVLTISNGLEDLLPPCSFAPRNTWGL